MATPYTVSFSNQRIWEFYNKHATLNVEQINGFLVDLLEKMLPEPDAATAGVQIHVAEQLMSVMKTMQTQMAHVAECVQQARHDTLANVTQKLGEFKKEYMEDVRMVLTCNVAEKIAPLIREQNSIMLDKTALLMTDALPKSSEAVSKQIQDAMKFLHLAIAEDTNKFLSQTITPRTLQDFVGGLEQKFHLSEQRMEGNLKDIRLANESLRALSTAQQQSTATLTTTIADMVKKLDNPSTKGRISENIVFNILNKVCPTAQIEYVGDKKESGDIMLHRDGKPTILVENKNWDSVVSKDEVRKFIHDIETQACCGLFLSQNTGIANKRNFEITVHKNQHVLLFLHDVNYDAEKIRLGIEIIDHFKEMLDKLDDKSSVEIIDRDMLDKINKEFQECCSQKLNILQCIKDMSATLQKQVADINFPNLELYLSSRYTFSVGKMVCEFCPYIARNQQALSAHQRSCANKRSAAALASAPSPDVQVQTHVTTTARPAEPKQKKLKIGGGLMLA